MAQAGRSGADAEGPGHRSRNRAGFANGLAPELLAALYAALVAGALLATALAAPGSGSFMEESARGMGVAAAAMLAAQFITSGRFETLSGRVGLDVVLGFHRFAAYLLVAFVILHIAAFVVPSFAQGPGRGFSHLGTLFTSRRMLTGVLALVGFGLIIVTSVMRDRWMSYEVWRFLHGFGALATLALAGHHVVTTGTAGFTPWLWWLWLAMFALAGFAFAHVYAGRAIAMRLSPWRLDEVKRLTPKLFEVVLTQTGGKPFSFRAGQFVWLSFAPRRLSLFDHPFSIASAPGELPRMRFLIKARGDFTRALPALAPGTLVGVDGPHGNLVEEGREADALVLVAGGVGLAPIIGVLRDLAARRDTRPVRCIYGAGSPANLVYAEEMRALEGRLNLRNFFTVDEPTPEWTGAVGPIDRTLVGQAMDGLPAARTLALLCGPTPMMASVADMIAEAGAPLSNIVYEKFEYD
jgi:predicted ferric reductase